MDRVRIRLCIGLLLLAGLLVACSFTDLFAKQSSTQAPATGTEVTITGIVVDTIDICVVDGICAFVIEAAGGRYTVIYNPGMAGCLNFDVPSEAITIGDRVAVFALVTGHFELFTCPSEAYYIRRSG